MNERARRQMEEDLEEECGELHPGMSHEVWQARIRERLDRSMVLTTAAEFDALWEQYGGPQVNLLSFLSDDAQYSDAEAREQMDEIDRIIEGASG